MSPADLKAFGDIAGGIPAVALLLAFVYGLLTDRIVTRGRYQDVREIAAYHRKRAEEAEDVILQTTLKYEQLVVVLQGIQEILRQRSER